MIVGRPAGQPEVAGLDALMSNAVVDKSVVAVVHPKAVVLCGVVFVARRAGTDARQFIALQLFHVARIVNRITGLADFFGFSAGPPVGRRTIADLALALTSKTDCGARKWVGLEARPLGQSIGQSKM